MSLTVSCTRVRLADISTALLKPIGHLLTNGGTPRLVKLTYQLLTGDSKAAAVMSIA